MNEPIPPGTAAVPDAPAGSAAVPAAGNPRAAGPAALPASSRLVWLSRIAGVVLLFGVPATAVWYFAIRQPAARNDLERFQGDWQMVVNDRATPNVVTIAGDRWQAAAQGIEGKAYKITLNETANPKEIDLDPADTARFVGPAPKLHGVYAFEDNVTVRVRVNDTTEPRPTTLDGPDTVVWVLMKVKPGSGAKAEGKK